MGIFVGIGNYIGRVRQIGDGGGQPIGPNDYYIITEDGIAVLTERGKHILLDKYVTEDEIATWVKEHMVFWYDMSKPVDTYSQNFNDWRSHPSVNADIIITSTSFVITRFATLNDTVKCYIPDQTKNFPGMKVEVKGIVDGQELYWGYSADVKLVNITQDGTYDIPPLGTVRGNLSFRNGNIVSACNITITQLPSGQSVPTNEILKANPYLQDFSGNNRPLKLNNFLFAAMSGVGGYDISSTYILPDRANVTVTDNRIIHITKKLSTTDNMVNIVPSNSNPTHRFKVTGLSDGRQVSLVNRNGGFYTFDNGEHEVTLTYPEGTTSLYNAIGVTGYRRYGRNNRVPA